MTYVVFGHEVVILWPIINEQSWRTLLLNPPKIPDLLPTVLFDNASQDPPPPTITEHKPTVVLRQPLPINERSPIVVLLVPPPTNEQPPVA